MVTLFYTRFGKISSGSRNKNALCFALAWIRICAEHDIVLCGIRLALV
jgi:hypothetical protein